MLLVLLLLGAAFLRGDAVTAIVALLAGANVVVMESCWFLVLVDRIPQ